MFKKLLVAVVVGLFAVSANAALHCTNGNGESIEWWPGLAKPEIDLTLRKEFVCYVGGNALIFDYINARFPGMLVQGQSTILFGDQARFLVTNVMRATRSDYDAIVGD